MEGYFRFMYEDKPIFYIEDQIFYDEITLAADDNFLKILTYDFLQGGSDALNGPDKIVLTETLANKFFGDLNPIGKFIEFGQGFLLEVTAIIKDAPANSHLKFDALISWETFRRQDGWGNINAYTYILLKPQAKIEEVKIKMPGVLSTFHELIAREYETTFEPIFENITDIHFSQSLDEDIAEKRNKSNLFILIAVVILFLLTGLINYLNLSLAELTAHLKKIGILRVFGGLSQGHNKMLISEIAFILIIVLPLATILWYYGMLLSSTFLSIQIDPKVWRNPLFISTAVSFLILLLASIHLNSYVLEQTKNIIIALKGKFNATQSGLAARKFLVATQLSFSIIMIGLIFIIVDQFHFIEKADVGFAANDMIVIKHHSNETSSIESFNESVTKLSGISSVGSSSYYPGIIETKYVFEVETEKGMDQLLVPMMTCDYAYLETLNIKMDKGRGFRNNLESDFYGSFIINETAAKEFGWKEALGKKIRGPVGGNDDAYQEGTVIGVVKDFNYSTLHSKIEPMIIFLSNDDWTSQYSYVKMNPIRSHSLVSAMEKEFKTRWPDYPFEWEFLDTKYLSLYKKDYEIKNIFEIGLMISVLVSGLGIFSISALLLSLRRKEMGIRKVVGASPIQLFILHVKSFLQFLIISILVAWPVIWFLSDKWLQNFAYHIEFNIEYVIAPTVIALLITFFTSGLHGIKNAMVNPVDILKNE